MQFTNAQMTILKQHLLNNTDPAIITAIAEGNHLFIAESYSTLVSPAFIVWRSSVGSNEIINAVTFSGAGGLISRSTGERDAFAILMAKGSIEPWRPNIRQAFADIFSGSGAGAPETRAAIIAVCKKSATNIERILATGTGTDASPAVMGYEGIMTLYDVHPIINYAG